MARRAWILLLVLMLVPLAPASAQTEAVVDCTDWQPDVEPGTPEWNARDTNNIFCAEERHLDKPAHPAPVLAWARIMRGTQAGDPYRLPDRHAGTRFRFERLSIGNLAAELYRPCPTDPDVCPNLPEGLPRFDPPYPAVLVLHGGLSRKELHWWASQPLAERGYMVVAFDGATSMPNVRNVINWLLATPDAPVATGHNPYWHELNRDRIGLSGHSMGGQAASVVGQEDPRVTAIVSWDRGTGAQLPAELDTPTLFTVGDYACQANPVCQPEPYRNPPNPLGPGSRGREYEIVRAADVDSMKIPQRASTHLDWVPSELSSNRWVEIVSVYYTVAWFDRYLKGAEDPAMAQDAFERLVATHFDDSVDQHNISQGIFDPVRMAASGDLFGGNVPYSISGKPAANLLSFYFHSKCYLTVPGTEERIESTNMRTTWCAPAQDS